MNSGFEPGQRVSQMFILTGRRGGGIPISPPSEVGLEDEYGESTEIEEAASQKPMKKRGFTMVEVLLAMALGGLVLAAASALLVTLGSALGRPATRDAFDAHVNGVAHFMTAVLEEATLAPLTKQEIKWLIRKVLWAFQESDDELITFT